MAISGSTHDAESYLPTSAAVEHVNAALYLRRPLLVTGPPGTGKSTLPYAVARELQARPGSALAHYQPGHLGLGGFYQYDPMTRLYAASQAGRGGGRRAGECRTLHPPWPARDRSCFRMARPRVLPIDEIDKSDIDLANDLLTVFEKGEYQTIELVRQEVETAAVMTADGDGPALPINRGNRCSAARSPCDHDKQRRA